MTSLEIKDLHVNIKNENIEILKGVNLTINTNEVTLLWDQMEQENRLCLQPLWDIQIMKSHKEISS